MPEVRERERTGHHGVDLRSDDVAVHNVLIGGRAMWFYVHFFAPELRPRLGQILQETTNKNTTVRTRSITKDASTLVLTFWSQYADVSTAIGVFLLACHLVAVLSGPSTNKLMNSDWTWICGWANKR